MFPTLKKIDFRFFWAPFLVALFASRSPGTVTSALISKALDSQQNLNLDTTLQEAMAQIGDKTGVRIEADPAVWDLLPWGEQTNISAKIQNRTLRQSLTDITQKLALEFELGDEAVQLKPMPALRRLGRRATLHELSALVHLSETPIQLASDHPTVHDVLDAVDAELRKAPQLADSVAIENRASDADQNQHIAVARNSTMAEALEDISQQTAATWYPWGRRIVIVAKREQIRTQLSKTISARYNGVDVSQVLLELFQRAGVDFTVDPGTYQRIPAAYRNVQLMLDNASVQQAMETIGGYTGLGFEITDSGVKVVNQSGPATRPDQAPAKSQ